MNLSKKDISEMKDKDLSLAVVTHAKQDTDTHGLLQSGGLLLGVLYHE